MASKTTNLGSSSVNNIVLMGNGLRAAYEQCPECPNILLVIRGPAFYEEPWKCGLCAEKEALNEAINESHGG